MKSKDIIFTAIFSVLLFIGLFVFAIVLSINPIAFFFSHALGSIPVGIIFMYMRAKTPKKGAIMLTGILIAIISFAIGIGYSAALGLIIGGILAEVISASGKYCSTVKNIWSYVVFIVAFWIGQVSVMILATKNYEKFCLKQGMTQEYTTKLIEFINGPMFWVALVMTIIGASIGGFLGQKIFKKHFANR